MLFSHKILLWYAQNKRTLPWRNTKNPYFIWLSEVILQQTKVAQGTPYYLNFIENFPTIQHLASAPQEKVLKLWQGLGYYSRARNLHETAIYITTNLNGNFPETYKELIKLKGIGDYTASAIASICFNAQEAVVDGNVYRVFSRYFGIDIPINSTEGVKYFKKLALKLLDKENTRDYNQGIMEFGAIQCTPKKPNCISCPLNTSCVALEKDIVNTLPIKIKKTKIKTRYFNYIVPLIKGNFTILNQRTKKGIWQGLWQFPLLELPKEASVKEVEKQAASLLKIKKPLQEYNTEPIVHKLSHQHLHTKFWILETTQEVENMIKIEDLEKYPVPVLIADFIKTYKF